MVSIGPYDTRWLEQLAIRAEERASRARRHALTARGLAGRHAARGDHDSELIFRRDAEGHERAAGAHERTAALYRRRVSRLTGPE
ncbi:MAG TPA: hypothetical protein VFN87_11020 [Solirubrobacteraceae bacterium]|nr:hypothetical protein [Solirubrobacteraceae bacterium]